MNSRGAKYGFITSLLIASLLLVNLPVAASTNAAQYVKQPEAPNATVTVGGGGTYATLKAAFDDINSGVLTGTIQIDVIGDTTETATALLNASGVLTASYTSVLIQPSGGSWVISGTMTAGSPLVDLNGADNVTINGLSVGGNALTIVNSTVSATSGTSTIRFINGATNNTVTNATILGAFGASVITNGGNIYFATDGSTGNGNDNNTISNNNIGPVSSTALPTKGVYSNGSTTTTAVNNSGNVITGNNIYDYFGAAVTSAGVYIAGGSTDFTISNNKFYQTAMRTQTTGAQHSAIWISNTSGNNFQVTGNTIGYASNAGIGTYTFVGVSSSVLIPIYLNVGTITATSVQGNTIAGFSMTTSGSGTSSSAPFRGIYVSSGLTTVGDASGNTIGSQSITNSIVFTSSSTSASDVIGIFNFGSSNWTVSNNTIGGITAANSSTGAANIYGIRVFTSSTVNFICQNNTIGGTVADSLQSTSTATGTTVEGILNSSPAGTITGNLIRNLTAAGGTGTTTGASVIGIAIAASSANHTLRQNTIHSLSNTNSSAATTLIGIQYTASSGTNLLARNFIHSFNVASSTGIVNGINVSGGTTTYQNNMIRLGIDAAGNGITTGAAFNGINETSGTDNFYFNSVYVGGSGVLSTTSNTFAFNSAVTANTRNYRDNVFVNARSNATGGGKHYAIRVGGTAPNPAGLTSNNNVITVTGAGGYIGLFNAVDQATLASWRVATGQDSNSFDLEPQFIAPAAITPDLHISPVITTVVEGNGFSIASVTDDFDGDVRANFTPTDIGADAGNFIGSDLTGPAITYTPLGNTSLTTDRALSANIVDVSGVPTSGSLQPRIYYNKNGGTWFSTQGNLVNGTSVNGSWNFTVTVSDFGGIAAGDVISYFVIAEDTASPANLASNPAGVAASDVNNVTTAPTPYTYTVVPAFSGSYNVGATEVYTSLTNSGGIFQAINAGALTGSVIINVTSDLTGETGLNALNQWNEDGVGGYTLLIRPSGTPVTVTGSNTGALIRFFGTDRLTLDGSLSGGSDRSLTIQNTNTGTSAAVIAIQSGTNGAQNNTIKNVIVLGQDPTTTLLGISLGGNTAGTLGADNDGNRVENNVIRRAIYGVYSAGQNAANPNLGTVISGNDLTGSGNDRIRRVGILVFNENGIQITRNNIGGIDSSESADAIGIGVGTQNVDSTTTTDGGVTNALITQNRVNGVNQSNTFSAAGIAVAGSTGGNNTIANNMLTGVMANSTSPDLSVGIFVAGVTGSDTRLYFNSVSMTGDRGATTSQMPGYGLAVTGSDPTVTSQNNIFRTSQTASGGGVNAKSYAIGMVASTFVNLNSNYNLFYASGANAGYFRTGSLSAGAGTDYTTLTAWQTAVSDDANSLLADPLFVADATNLHLQDASPAIWAGTPIAGITTDIDGDTRCVNAPSIGADEGQRVPVATFAFVPASPLINQPIDFTATVLTGTAPFTYTWDFGDGSSIGSGNPVSHTYTVVGTYDVTLTVECQCGVAVHTAPVTVSAAATPPSLGPLQSSSPTALGNVTYFTGTLLAGSTPITYTWDFGDGTLLVDGLNTSHTYTQSGLYTVTLTADNVAGTATATTSVNVLQSDLGILKTASPNPVGVGESVTYQITVTNHGPEATSSATVVDTLPVSFHFASASTGCTHVTGTVTCSIGALSNGQSVSISITVTTTALGLYVNTVTVSGPSPDPVMSNNIATAVTTVASPVIELTPDRLAAIQIPNLVTTQTLTISNTGAVPLRWNLYESLPALTEAEGQTGSLATPFNPATLARPQEKVEAILAAASTPAEVLPNRQTSVTAAFSEGFDDVTTLPGNGWAQINRSNPLGGTNWYQGVGTVFPAHTGVISTSYIAANYNNTTGAGTISNWLLTPEVQLSNGTVFTFYTRVPSPVNYPDRLEVRLSVNGASTNVGTTETSVGDFTTLLLTINPSLTVSGYPTIWTAYSITVSGLAAPTTGRLGFRYYVTNGGPSGANSSYIGIDTFSYSPPTSVCSTPGDLPWLSALPTNGTINAGSSSTVNVRFDSTGLATGVYTGTLCLTSNDVANPLKTVPVTLTVNAQLAQLTSNHVGNGAVDQNPQPPYAVGDVVTLTAVPDVGWSFANWSGDLSGTTNPITITLTSDKVVTATFTHNPVNLTVNTVGSGSVLQTPPAPYLYGDVVTLTANAATNWAFAGWSGDLTGTTNPITITLNGTKIVTATFTLTCEPMAGVDFTYAPPAPKVGQLVTFNGSALTGTAPITYSWNFGDSATGSGSPIMHVFPLTVTTRSYTVTLMATNACGTASASRLLQIRPLEVFLPLVMK